MVFVLSCLEMRLGRYLITILLMDECDGTVYCTVCTCARCDAYSSYMICKGSLVLTWVSYLFILTPAIGGQGFI
ncbi:hypothetical protein B9Z19DRAFT_1077470, partial [Tuber borchii]